MHQNGRFCVLLPSCTGKPESVLRRVGVRESAQGLGRSA